jgi:hypothetical protein
MTIQINVCDNELPYIKIPIGKVLRFSIIHTESVNGFVNNALLIKVNEGGSANLNFSAT